MELQIYSPSEDGFIKEISWNHEEIKKELAERVKFYTGMVYTEDQIKNAKADRAKLRKFVDVLEIKRKEIKKQCLAPYETFEKQMKELVSIVNEPIMMIDSQVKDYEEGKKAEKMKAIEAHWQSLLADNRIPSGITFNQLFDEKWLNLSVNLNAVIKEIDEKLEQIEKDLATLKNLPEFAFEAIEAYKDTLDINQAIEQGKRLAEIQKRKEEQQKMNEAFERMGTSAKVVAEGIANLVDAAKEAQTEKQWVSFSALLSTEDALALKDFFNSRNIEFKSIRG